MAPYPPLPFPLSDTDVLHKLTTLDNFPFTVSNSSILSITTNKLCIIVTTYFSTSYKGEEGGALDQVWQNRGVGQFSRIGASARENTV